MDEEYDNYFGFTETEVQAMLEYYKVPEKKKELVNGMTDIYLVRKISTIRGQSLIIFPEDVYRRHTG